jgi:hypothetical protein
MWEAQVEGSWSEAIPRQQCETLFKKQVKQKRAGVQLKRESKALSSNPSTAKKKKKVTRHLIFIQQNSINF